MRRERQKLAAKETEKREKTEERESDRERERKRKRERERIHKDNYLNGGRSSDEDGIASLCALRCPAPL